MSNNNLETMSPKSELARQKAEAERQKAERDRFEADRRALEAEKAAIRAEQEARARAESVRLVAEQRLRDEAARAIQAAAAAEAERVRLGALRPDAEKIKAFGGKIEELAMLLPVVTSREAVAFVAEVAEILADVVLRCERFGE